MNYQDRVFPSWNRRGGCASKKKARSLRSGADGVVIMVNVDAVKLPLLSALHIKSQEWQIPLLVRRGGCGINKKTRSLRRRRRRGGRSQVPFQECVSKDDV